MALAQDLAADADILAQPDVQAVREHDEACGDLLAVRQGQLLPVRGGGDGRGLGMDRRDVGGDLGADRVDERVVEDVVLPVRTLVDELAIARDPDVQIGRRRAQHRLGDAGLAQQRDLRGVELLAAEILRILRVRIDQHGVDAGAAEHRGGGGTRQPTPDTVSYTHLDVYKRQGLLAAPAAARSCRRPGAVALCLYAPPRQRPGPGIAARGRAVPDLQSDGRGCHGDVVDAAVDPTAAAPGGLSRQGAAGVAGRLPDPVQGRAGQRRRAAADRGRRRPRGLGFPRSPVPRAQHRRPACQPDRRRLPVCRRHGSVARGARSLARRQDRPAQPLRCATDHAGRQAAAGTPLHTRLR